MGLISFTFTTDLCKGFVILALKFCEVCRSVIRLVDSGKRSIPNNTGVLKNKNCVPKKSACSNKKREQNSVCNIIIFFEGCLIWKPKNGETSVLNFVPLF